MALSITVNGGGTFSASMEEGPVSFTASLGAVPGPKGDTGATGPTGVIAATAPILYDSGTQTVSISATPTFTSVTATTFNATNLVFSDGTQTTAFVGEARKEYIIARNNTGSTIAKGKVVYLSGATGNKATMAPAQADAEATSARTIGILVEETANNGDGKVVISGAAENIDTSAFSAGDTVYLSATTAGAMTTTLPAAPLHGVVIGVVTRSNPTVGSIEVAINNYQELEELSDVSVADKANNDGLFWETSSSTWRSKTIAEVLGLTPIALTSLSASAPIAYNSGTGAFTFDSSGFLLKADNLSGLASASTARTNLGLGTMATETASNYALLASPSFTGNPTAPTPATSDNDTSIATTAFVNAYCPAASESTAGKVELATDAEAVAGASTSVAMTPANVRRHLLSHRYRPIPILGWATATSGTGASASATTAFYPSISGPNAGVAGNARLTALIGTPSRARSTSIFNWSKAVGFTCRMNRSNITDTAHTVMYSFGKNLTWPGYGDLTARGIAIKVVGSTVSLQVHNGTTLTSVTGSASFPSGNVCVDFYVFSDGAGNVELFQDGTSVATTTAGPTGNSATNGMLLAFEVDSTASSTVRLVDNFLGCVSFWHDC